MDYLSKKRIKDTADYVTKIMKAQGVIVQRYDALSTLSVYLKFDYGVCNTLRISDHVGKNKLHYKYNLRADIKKYTCMGEGATEMNFYPIGEVDACIKKILLARFSKIATYGLASYESLMEETLSKKAHTKNRFWLSATHV